MSLFGTLPNDTTPSVSHVTMTTKSRISLFDDDDDNGSMTRSTSDTLFNDDDDGDRSPWDMPTPRKQQSRADILRRLLADVPVPDSYVDAFDSALAQDGRGSRMVTPAGIAKTLAAAHLDADQQVHIMNILAPSRSEVSLGRDEFNVLLALVALAQDGDTVSLDSVDERRRSKSLLPRT
jgi:sorting nexin-8